MTIKVLSLILLASKNACDMLSLELDLPSGVFPYKGNTQTYIYVASGEGKAYIEKHFPDVDYKTINVD